MFVYLVVQSKCASTPAHALCVCVCEYFYSVRRSSTLSPFIRFSKYSQDVCVMDSLYALTQLHLAHYTFVMCYAAHSRNYPRVMQQMRTRKLSGFPVASFSTTPPYTGELITDNNMHLTYVRPSYIKQMQRREMHHNKLN